MPAVRELDDSAHDAEVAIRYRCMRGGRGSGRPRSTGNPRKPAAKKAVKSAAKGKQASPRAGARITTAAPLVPRCVRPSVRNIPLHLEPDSERRGDRRLADHGQMVGRVLPGIWANRLPESGHSWPAAHRRNLPTIQFAANSAPKIAAMS